MSDACVADAGADVAALIQQRLRVLEPLRVQVVDDSARHAGHAGAKGGGGHYRLQIVAAAFAGHGRLARHRMLHEALGDLLHTRIHALSIQALTPAEAAATVSNPS